VITPHEDALIDRKGLRSNMLDNPDLRWTTAGIVFQEVPDPNSEALALRCTGIGGVRYADDYQVIWRGLPFGRIMKQPGGGHRGIDANDPKGEIAPATGEQS
jgi:hypothetical protein